MNYLDLMTFPARILNLFDLYRDLQALEERAAMVQVSECQLATN
jgi:hypothetical protein